MTAALDGWQRTEFTAHERTRQVFRRGDGPGVIVIHEIPGITPKVARFANDLVASGFTVVMPSLVGTPGRSRSALYETASILKVCVAREFTHWALQRTSPIVEWLRALASDLHASAGGPGVGAVGMCFSGGFALGMMVDDVMVAPVLSQPSMPFAVGKAARKADVNLSPADAERVAARAAQGCEVLGLKFDQDKLVGTRFGTLRTLLGDAFIAVELPSTSKRDHSVLTEQRDEESVQRVIDFLTSKLQR
ncbi:MAG TPA: dienelactone hydrolase family protein [Ilumatobacteraceae bacterium]